MCGRVGSDLISLQWHLLNNLAAHTKVPSRREQDSDLFVLLDMYITYCFGNVAMLKYIHHSSKKLKDHLNYVLILNYVHSEQIDPGWSTLSWNMVWDKKSRAK